ncbi:MAG: hypothetical protein H0X46_08495, partial [Bacteroidetes bacterium]|nr:hypothetical protein [Bacteroidota bacterium]
MIRQGDMKHIRTIFIYIIFFTCTKELYSQTGTIRVAKPKSDSSKAVTTEQDLRPVCEVYYGYKIFVDDFQNKFNTIERFKLDEPLQLVGIGIAGPTTINRLPRTYYMHLLYNHVLPHAIQLNDSLPCKITGGIFSLAWGKYLITKSGNFYANFYIGFNTGRIRFYGNEPARQKNPFFSPKVGIQPKLYAGKLSIGIIMEAEYDVS